MFTQNPINGADERMIEASWGLGEAVVAGRVIPDNFRIDRSGAGARAHAGAQEDRDPRRCRTAARSRRTSPPELVEQLCLDDDQLAQLNALADRCEEVYGPARDIEWAFAGGQLYLLQCRAITRAGSSPRPPGDGRARRSRSSSSVPLFARPEPARASSRSRALFKERRFAAGETVVKEGSGGAAFFVIESGEATVTIGGKQRGDARSRATTSARSR